MRDWIWRSPYGCSLPKTLHHLTLDSSISRFVWEKMTSETGETPEVQNKFSFFCVLRRNNFCEWALLISIWVLIDRLFNRTSAAYSDRTWKIKKGKSILLFWIWVLRYSVSYQISKKVNFNMDRHRRRSNIRKKEAILYKYFFYITMTWRNKKP